MPTHLSNYALDTFLAPKLSELNRPAIEPLATSCAGAESWVRMSAFERMLRVRIEPSKRQYIFNFLRRAEAACADYEEGRQFLQEYVSGGNRNGGNVMVKGNRAIKFRSCKTDCRICEVRAKCLRNPERSETRQVYFFTTGRSEQASETFTAKMKRKIDSIEGRLIYNRRLGTAEPVFANLRAAVGLD